MANLVLGKRYRGAVRMTEKTTDNSVKCSQMPTMLIYAKIAAEHGISEERVRKIIRAP